MKLNYYDIFELKRPYKIFEKLSNDDRDYTAVYPAKSKDTSVQWYNLSTAKVKLPFQYF